MKNKKMVSILIIIVFIFVFIVGLSLRKTSYKVDYIATLNGEIIPLNEYKIYLREQIIIFENIGGTDIWKTDFDGIPATEFAKQNALDSIVLVKITNKQAPDLNLYLTDEDKQDALINAEMLYQSLSIDERENTDFNTIITIMEESILKEKVSSELTRNYNVEERSIIFDEIYADWLQDIIIEKNAEVWDSISIY